MPLNYDAIVVLEEQLGKHEQFCFTYQGKPILWEITNSAWHTALAKAGLKDFRFHDLRILGLHGIVRLARAAMN